MTLLEDLWYGNLSPIERPLDKSGVSYQLQLRAGDAEDRLFETLSPEQKTLFLHYEDAETAKASAMEAEAFCVGFRLAVQLLTESMQPLIPLR